MSDTCPKCGAKMIYQGDVGRVFVCHSMFYADGGAEDVEGEKCIRNQRDQLKSALTALMPFVLEEYYPDMCTPAFKSAVETAKRLIE